eukprot:Filipodium_phascolosomae@DN2561_c0_g1_i10.p1
MDDRSSVLIGTFGYCQQELVNLMLYGQAVSNVFDGKKLLSEGADPNDPDIMALRGINHQCLCGYLTSLEAMRYCQVGFNYKYPLFPIWVIGSSSHYTTLFTPDLTVAAVSPAKLLQIKASLAFNDEDPEHTGIVKMSTLRSILTKLDMQTRESPARIHFSKSYPDIILSGEFQEWIMEIAGAAHELKSKRFMKLIYYDGQIPPGPQATGLEIETSDCDWAVGQGEARDMFLGLLRTRWENCDLLNAHELYSTLEQIR